MAESSKKKVVRVEAPKGASSTRAGGGSAAARGADGGGPDEPVWTPTPEAKRKATRLRWIAAAAWAVAIGIEIFAIFWILKQVPVNMWLLIGAIVVTGVLSVVGSLLWKQANRLDPASRSDSTRFFVQNQLGAIIAIIAFLPLIILIFTNKNMDGKQKALAGGVGIVVLLVAAIFGTSFTSPSQEQYAAETNIVEKLTGVDEVFWVKGGSVFHVCETVPDVNKESADGQIYRGTVAAAHAGGKDRLTLRWQSEAVKYCGYTQEQVDAVESELSGDVAVLENNDAPADAPADAPTEGTESPTE